MKAVTIDNFDIKVHERYAQDQFKLEPKYLTETNLVAPHSEITGTSAIYSSKWEELFEIHLRNISWAAFTPPPKYTTQPNKFFTYRILPNISFEDEREQDDGEQDQQEEKQKKNQELLEKVLKAEKGKSDPVHVFEKDRTAIVSLLEAAKFLNQLLQHIQSKKLQYQKG
jgi:hypothetical protein